MALVWSVCLALFVLVYFFFIAPRLTTKSELVKESDEKRQLYEAAVDAANEENKKKLAVEVEELRSQLGDYTADFEDFANLTFAISRIAAEKQVSSFAVKTTDEIRGTDQLDSKNIQENMIEITFESNFRQFATFLNTLERHRPVVFVDRFKLSRGGPGEITHRVDMDLSIFVRKKTKS